jgi:hypothetical protein
MRPVNLRLFARQGDQTQVGLSTWPWPVVTDEITKVAGAAAIAALLDLLRAAAAVARSGHRLGEPHIEKDTIVERFRLRPGLRAAGAGVQARIRCGNGAHALVLDLTCNKKHGMTSARGHHHPTIVSA